MFSNLLLFWPPADVPPPAVDCGWPEKIWRAIRRRHHLMPLILQHELSAFVLNEGDPFGIDPEQTALNP